VAGESRLHTNIPKGLPIPRLQTLEYALTELFELLESHAPMWYAQKHHRKAAAALRGRQPGVKEVLTDIFALLETYAPVWYTSEHRRRAQHALRNGKLD
jgi:hypothetical protein